MKHKHWKNEEIIFVDEDNTSIIWGNFISSTPKEHKRLGINNPNDKDEMYFTVIPSYLTLPILEKILTNAIFNYPKYVAKIQKAIEEWGDYELDKTLY